MGGIFPKTSVPLAFMATYRISLTSAGSISLVRTFHDNCNLNKLFSLCTERCCGVDPDLAPSFTQGDKLELLHTFIHSNASLHCFIFLINVISVLFFSIFGQYTKKILENFSFFYYIWLKWIGYRSRSAGLRFQSRSGSSKMMPIRPDPDPQHWYGTMGHQRPNPRTPGSRPQNKSKGLNSNKIASIEHRAIVMCAIVYRFYDVPYKTESLSTVSSVLTTGMTWVTPSPESMTTPVRLRSPTCFLTQEAASESTAYSVTIYKI
jgi:hypothetical protein